MKIRKKGFTLIELLAVIVILGLLMAIAIPSVTKYITQSRKSTLVKTIDNYISALTNQVNNMEYVFTGTKASLGNKKIPLIYAVPIECIALERGGTDPFGEWYQANNSYWAYVLVQYNDEASSYTYGFTFKDSAGYGLYPTTREKLNEKGNQIVQDLDMKRPTNGSIINTTIANNWKGWNVSSSNYLQVLEATKEGGTGDGQTTCTLAQKGKNYAEIERQQDIVNNQDDYTLISIESMSTVAFWQHRSKIKNVTIQNSINIPASVPASDKWDVSVSGKGKLMAYVVPNASDASYYDLFIQGDGKVYANPDSSFLFDEFRYIDTLDLTNFDTSRVTDMTGMFYAAGYNSASFTINLGSDFDTSNVSNMEQLFNQMGYKSTVLTLNLGSKFDTSKVINMRRMFQNTGRSNPNFTLTLGDKFVTDNVTNMEGMFNGTGASSSLFRVDCSGWNVLKVTNNKNFYPAADGKVTPPTWPS